MGGGSGGVARFSGSSVAIGGVGGWAGPVVCALGGRSGAVRAFVLLPGCVLWSGVFRYGLAAARGPLTGGVMQVACGCGCPAGGTLLSAAAVVSIGRALRVG